MFTQEVLAAVLQLLLEQDPIPVMFMRTVSSPASQKCNPHLSPSLWKQVLQSLGLCPRLVSFVMTILMKLIGKQASLFVCFVCLLLM